MWAEGSLREHCWLRETDWSMMMMRRMSPPYIPGDRSQDWIKEDEEHVEKENAFDFVEI